METNTKVNKKLLKYVENALKQYESRIDYFEKNGLDISENINKYLAKEAKRFIWKYFYSKSNFKYVIDNYSSIEKDVVMSYYTPFKSIRKGKIDGADAAEIYLSFLHLIKKLEETSYKTLNIKLNHRKHLRFDIRSPGDIDRIKNLDRSLKTMKNRTKTTKLKKIKKIDESYQNFKTNILRFVRQLEKEENVNLKKDINLSFKYLYKKLRRKDQKSVSKIMYQSSHINQPKIKIINDELFFH